MKSESTISLFTSLLKIVVLVQVAATAGSAQAAPTFWTGPITNYTQSAASPVDVLVPGAVSLTRAGNHWLFNTNIDKFGAVAGTPSDTEWAFGTLDNYNSLVYQPFSSFRDGNLSAVLVTDPLSPMVVHLINEDIYLSLTFTNWPGGGGFFSYKRSTPATVVTPPAPAVTITNPASGAVFAAPANVTIAAAATVSTGTITNVAFFGNSSSLGARQSPPFSITANNLAAGPYALTAVATAAGISATSSVVNISVVSPGITSLSAPSAAPGVGNGQFSFGYSANIGLSYVVESSTNMLNWTPVVTNVATGNPVLFTNGISGGGKFYRVGRLPNP